MPMSLLCFSQHLYSTNGKIKIEPGPTLPVEYQVQKEYTGKEMTFSHFTSLFRLTAGNFATSFTTYSQLTPASHHILCPEVITMARWVLAKAGPSDLTRGPTLSCPQAPGARSEQHTRNHFLSAHHLVHEVVLFLAYLCLLFLHLSVFLSEGWSQRNPLKSALQKAHSNSAESIRACARLSWDQVALAFSPHCAVHDTEVSRRQWRE